MNLIYLQTYVANGGKGSGNFAPGQGRGVGKPGSGRTSGNSSQISEKILNSKKAYDEAKLLGENSTEYKAARKQLIKDLYNDEHLCSSDVYEETSKVNWYKENLYSTHDFEMLDKHRKKRDKAFEKLNEFYKLDPRFETSYSSDKSIDADIKTVARLFGADINDTVKVKSYSDGIDSSKRGFNPTGGNTIVQGNHELIDFYGSEASAAYEFEKAWNKRAEDR